MSPYIHTYIHIKHPGDLGYIVPSSVHANDCFPHPIVHIFVFLSRHRVRAEKSKQMLFDCQKSIWSPSYKILSEDFLSRCAHLLYTLSTFLRAKQVMSEVTKTYVTPLYKAQVVSICIIMYNCNSWAAPAASFEYLNVTHRRHLQTILNIKRPTGFSNSHLYKLCDTTSLSGRVIAFR